MCKPGEICDAPQSMLRRTEFGGEAAAPISIWWTPVGDVSMACLDEGERKRISTFARSTDRALHGTSQVLRRILLAREIGSAPSDLRFEFGCRICGSRHHGVPRLASGTPHNVCFSISHASDKTIVAIARGLSIGADIDYEVDPSTATELNPFVRSPHDDESLSFMECWTAKEAALKQTGLGLTVPPTAVWLKRTGFSIGIAHIKWPRCERPLWLSWFRLEGGCCGAVAANFKMTVEVKRGSQLLPFKSALSLK